MGLQVLGEIVWGAWLRSSSMIVQISVEKHKSCDSCSRRPAVWVDTDNGWEYCNACLVETASGKRTENP